MDKQLRELLTKAADALAVFNGHDSHANLVHQYGENWWTAISALEGALRSTALRAQPEAQAVATLINRPSGGYSLFIEHGATLLPPGEYALCAIPALQADGRFANTQTDADERLVHDFLERATLAEEVTLKIGSPIWLAVERKLLYAEPRA